MILLTSDRHLTDNPADEYRWRIFDEVHKAIKQEAVDRMFILGDLCDRKDRHSAELVNRLVTELLALRKRWISITILKGNHDAPLRGTPYWSFLSALDGVRFITQPTADKDLLLLPHSTNPKQEWEFISFEPYRAAMIHQTTSGLMENGRELDPDPNMVQFPRSLTVYSGDVHTPVTGGPITYVGCPHPIKFGDHYLCRLLVLNDQYEIVKEIKLNPIRKAILEVSSLQELKDAELGERDQVQVRYSLTQEQLAGWPVAQQEIVAWAQNRGILVQSVEAKTAMSTAKLDQNEGVSTLTPQEVLTEFAEVDGIELPLLKSGQELVQEWLDSR